MAGNLLPIDPHVTFINKVSNFPDNIYYFNEGDDLTTLMKILLGNSGTGQLRNLQTAARLAQQQIEFSNLDEILGMILDVKRLSSEIYSFSTNPFIDQLSSSNWQEIIKKDANYRERLLGAAEAFQAGATAWSIITLCEAMSGIKFYATESWRTPGYGRAQANGISSDIEIVLIPIVDGTFFSWDQAKAHAILNAVSKIIPSNFVVSFGKPISNFVQVPLSYVAASGYSEYFFLQPTITAIKLNAPANIPPGSETRYWLQNGGNVEAPFFAHLNTQEVSIDMTGNIVTVSTTNSGLNNASYTYNSLSAPTLEVTSTIYGAQ